MLRRIPKVSMSIGQASGETSYIQIMFYLEKDLDANFFALITVATNMDQRSPIYRMLGVAMRTHLTEWAS